MDLDQYTAIRIALLPFPFGEFVLFQIW